jgi:putative hydrolase of the HAD superfamily
MITTVIFDLDDTLFPERDFVLSGFRAVGSWLEQHRGVRGFFDCAARRFRAGERGRIFNDALPECGCLEGADLVGQLIEVYRSHFPAIQLFDDAACALAHFEQIRTVAILTDGFLATQKQKVKALGLDLRVRHIVYSDDFGRANWKPSRMPYERLQAITGAKPDECVYVGDNPAKDFVAAKSLGWQTVHVERPEGEYKDMIVPASHQAHHKISTLTELQPLLAASFAR